MTTSKERVSALVDNHSVSEQSLKAVLNDPSAIEIWDHYHIIGDAMRDDLPEQLDLSLSQRIADALELEPAIVAPKPRHSLFSVVKPNIQQFMRVAGQYGIAASVAVAVLVGVQQYQHSSELADIKQGPVLNTVPVGGSAAIPVSVNYQSERTHSSALASSQMTEQQLQEQRQRIARYIQDHQLQQRLSPAER
jgi:sigma-E factor negative regulatory protein RseA